MQDQSFNVTTMSQMLRKSDFKIHPDIAIPANREAAISAAVDYAHSKFQGRNPLSRSRLKSKDVYQIKNLSDLLVIRKLRTNVEQVVRLRQQGRRFIVANLAHLISEGVPYRLYRLDVASFYESFKPGAVLDKLDSLSGLSPLSKKLLRFVLEIYANSGGKGIPRGISLSATLSELMMKDFDTSITSRQGVHFFARYVDDILIITNAEEDEREFLDQVKRVLPPGLLLSQAKKHVCAAPRFLRPAANPCPVLAFDYLGYRFSVSNPAKRAGSGGQQFRDVAIDIAGSKLARIKTRIVRAFLSFIANQDFALLFLRIKYLTSNISVKDMDTNTYKLAGIYYNYPQITPNTAKGLSELDDFLRNAILSKKGRVFATTSGLLSRRQKTDLLGLSFRRGHERRAFVHFHPSKVRAILECWQHGE